MDQLVKPAKWVRSDPYPTRLETPRFLIRPFTHDDAPALFAAIESSRDTLQPWLPWTETENHSLPMVHFSIEKMIREQREPECIRYSLGVFDRATGEFVGGTGFHYVKFETHQAEVGYWVKSDKRRQGICTESTVGMINWLFTPQDKGGWGFRRIEILCAAGNIASQAVPRKIGLREEARFVKDRWVTGRGWDDTLLWGVLVDEWDFEKGRVKE